MSLCKPKAVYAASQRQYTAAGGEVKYLGVVFPSGGRRSEEIDTRVGKANAVVCVLLLCSQKTGAFRHCKAVSFKIGLYSDPYLR